MKLKFYLLVLIATMVIALVSCGGDGRKHKLNYVDEYYIEMPCTGAFTKSDLDLMVTYINRGNKSAYDNMILEGKLYYLNANDVVKMLDIGFEYSKVQVVSDDNKEIWIVNTFIADR